MCLCHAAKQTRMPCCSNAGITHLLVVGVDGRLFRIVWSRLVVGPKIRKSIGLIDTFGF